MKLNLSILQKNLSKIIKQHEMLKNVRPVYLFGVIFVFVSIYFISLYSSNLKERRTQEISAFLSNDQTLLLK